MNILLKTNQNIYVLEGEVWYMDNHYSNDFEVSKDKENIDLLLIINDKKLELKDNQFFYDLEKNITYVLKKGKFYACEKKAKFSETIFFSFNNSRNLFNKLEIKDLVRRDE